MQKLFYNLFNDKYGQHEKQEKKMHKDQIKQLQYWMLRLHPYPHMERSQRLGLSF